MNKLTPTLKKRTVDVRLEWLENNYQEPSILGAHQQCCLIINQPIR